MTAIASTLSHRRGRPRLSTSETRGVRWLLTGIVLAFLALVLFVPLVAVFYEAFRKGFGAYLAALHTPDALSAMRLTLFAALIAVICNAIFGVAAAWAIAKVAFRDRQEVRDLTSRRAVPPQSAGVKPVLQARRRHRRARSVGRRGRT